MVVFGIDASTVNVGYFVMDELYEELDSGVISGKTTTARELYALVTELGKIIEKHAPEVIVIEDVFYSINVNVVKTLSRIRGAIEMMIGAYPGKIFEAYMACTARKAMGIKGTCNKAEVQLAFGEQEDIIPKADAKLIHAGIERAKETKPKKERVKAFNRISKGIEKEFKISEHVADAWVLCMAYLENNKRGEK